MSHPAAGPILVAGATGKQGSAVCRALLQRGFPVRGLTRNRSSAAARQLARHGVEIVEGHFDDSSSLARALREVTGVFAMSTPYESGVPAELRQGVRFIDTAAAFPITHFVYSSVAGADRHTGIPHFESKYQIELHLRASGLPFTILAPVYFLENLLSVNMLAQIRQGRLSLPLPGDRRLQVIPVQDLGQFAALVLARPLEFVGERIELASDEVTGQQMAGELSRRLGRVVEYVRRPTEQVRAWNPDYAQFFEWLDRMGFHADIPYLRNQYPETGWQSFVHWAARQPWTELLGANEAA